MLGVILTMVLIFGPARCLAEVDPYQELGLLPKRWGRSPSVCGRDTSASRAHLNNVIGVGCGTSGTIAPIWPLKEGHMTDRHWTVKDLAEALKQFPSEMQRFITRWGQTAPERWAGAIRQGVGRER
jgi:hypothetical protein